MSNGWKYVGKGERYSYAVPTRDISAAEYDRLNPLDQRRVRESGAYKPVTDAEAKKADTKPADTEKKGAS